MPSFEKNKIPTDQKAENLIETMEDELFEFIAKGGYTVYQVSEAYYRMMGAVAQPTDDPEIITLLTEMQRFEKEGLPINRYAKIIIDLQRIEEIVPTYLKFVSGLPVTEKEKQMLCSLVEKKRGGNLQVTIGDEPMFELVVRGDEAVEHNAMGLRVALEKILAQANGRPIRLDFIEFL